MRRNWVLLVCGGSVLVAGAMVPAWFMPNDLLKGIVIGGAVVGVPAALWNLVVQVTGTGYSMMGEQAELWTATELRKNREDRLVNHVSLGPSDIDHVVVGPRGLVVVETKWSSRSWHERDGTERVLAAVNQVRRECRRMNLWSPIKTEGISATPLVVLWGHRVREWPEADRIRYVDEVPVIAGPALRRWMATRPGAPLDDAEINRAFNVLVDHVVRRDRADQVSQAMPRSVGDVLGAVAQFVGASAMGLVASVFLIDWFGPWWGLASTLVSAGAAVPVLMLRRIRRAAQGWLVGSALPLVGAVGVLIVHAAKR